MKMRSSWIIYSCLIFGTGTVCDRILGRRQAVSFRPENTDDKFYCSNGQPIEWSLLCDGFEDCSDGSDETKQLCALYEFETNMTMDCGRVHNMRYQETSDEAQQSIFELAPWTVAIFQMYTSLNCNKFFLLQYGSIIAPNIVITCGYYFMHSSGLISKQTPIDDGRFKVGSMINLKEDYNLLTDVTMIYLIVNDKDHIGTDDAFQTIAVIVLANKLPLSYGFTPICIDWFSKYDIWKETQMQIIGYILGPNYSVYYTTKIDKTFSININKDSHISGGYYGSVSGILYSDSYFLTGILYNWSFRNRNNLKEVDTLQFLDIKYHIPSIRGILNKHVAVNSCVLPTVQGVIYSYEYSNEILPHGTLIDRHVNVIENCEVGYHKAFRYSFRFCLGKGKWLSSPDKLCFKMCPPLESESVDIMCTYYGNYVNCSNPSIPDTIAKPLCKSLYTTPNGHEEDPLELLCQPNGAWNKELYRCNPSCGKVYTINNGMIMGGETASNTTAPWNVGVYRLNKKNSTNYDLICGGSIISPNLVVSAAHCFWVKGMLYNIISVNDGQYKISVGKNSRNITMIDNGCTKILNVKTIHLNEYYHGVSGFHADDIAIIVLQNKIPFSIGVSPICVDWTGKNTIPDGAKGKIVGWGKTEKGNSSFILLEAYLPIINYRSCRNMYTNGFESYVTKDKFCAGSARGQGVHEGDSGAGLSYLHSNNLYILIGIVSVKDPNTNNSIALFTDVKHHIEWIRSLYNNKTL